MYSNLFYFMLYVQMALLNEFYCGHGYGFCCLCGILLCSILKQSVGLSVLCEYAIAPYFAYCGIFQQSVLITYFPPHKVAFLTTILIFFVFLLPISIRFHYLSHLFANRMAPSMCPNPCGTRWGSCFLAILYHISAYFRHIFGVYAVCIFF